VATTQPRSAQPGVPGASPAKDMVWVPGGTFLMGSEDFYPEERPVHRVTVDGFWMDAHPVTNAQFRRFVKATGACNRGRAATRPGRLPGRRPRAAGPRGARLPPDQRSGGPARLAQLVAWVPGADWRHPEGPGSTLHGRDRHPVVQVAYDDAVAYAAWAGKQLPSQAEWERAARGGLESKVFCWGDEFAPKGRMMANTWQGEFPWQNLLTDRYGGTSPVGAFPPNGYGLHDMAGNVWEWTCDYFTPRHPDEVAKPCCVPRSPQVTAPVLDEAIPRRVMKGGSHLCAPNYCLRYRPAARQGEAVDTATTHIGFRCVLRDAPAGA
jgi:sulfatase modifying factor 1